MWPWLYRNLRHRQEWQIPLLHLLLPAKAGHCRCDQQRIPADRLEDAILAQTVLALTDGAIFLEAANKALDAWTADHPSREADLGRLAAEIAEKRKAATNIYELSKQAVCPSGPARTELRNWKQRQGS